MAESDHAGTESRRASEATTGSQTLTRRKSRLLSIAKKSFMKSGGQRGASVETLRGTHGADFENKAVVTRGGGEGVFCGCFGSSDADEALVLIKGPFLFVFKNENSQSPKYAVTLAHLKATVKEEGHGLSTHGHTTVNLETALGDVEYTVKFHTDGHLEVATTFANVVTQQAATGEADEVKKRLGHSNISTKRGSVAYAESIALKKVKDQPEKLATRDEIVVDAMPAVSAVAAGGYIHGPI